MGVVTPSPGNESPVWSPDGARIAYVSGAGLADSDIWVSSVGSGRLARLTRGAGLDAYPAWSPDGSSIAWTSERRGRLGIWVMAGDGSRKRALTRGPNDAHLAWSPDGRRIAYFDVATGSLELVGFAGGAPRRLSGPAEQSGPAAPAWSPDGRQIAVSAAGGALYSVAADGTGARRLTLAGAR